MAFIRYVSEHDQEPHDRVPDPDHIIQIHSLHPAVMRHHYDLYRALMHETGPLTRREREVIAVRVSGLNRCPY